MNAFGASLLWGALQVTLFSLAGMSLYLVVRRLGPAAGSLAAAAFLFTTLGVSALTLSPWPRWFTLAPGEQTASDAASTVQPVAEAPEHASSSEAAVAAPADLGDRKTISNVEVAGAAWSAFWRQLKHPVETPASSSRLVRWPTLVGLIFVVGVSAALLRLVLGLLAVRRLRKESLAIADESLRSLTAQICRQLKCRHKIEVRESLRLAAPATIGWRRPLVLLPVFWREWTPSEQRVVLAHEIAHVGRGDYIAALLAQFSVAMHFYHPIVHWLARRLRLEQELAADALGAEAVGGREAYLITLAQMALRQDDRAIAWAARPFLPGRGAFLRRIDMLRNPRQFRPAAMSRGRQVAIVALIGSVGLLFAGLRGPAGESLAQGPAKPAKAEGAAEIDWSYIPASAAAVAVIRPADVLARPEMQPLLKLLNEQAGVSKNLGLNVEDIAEIKLALPNFPAPGGPPPSPIVVMRTKQAHDWKSFGDKSLGNGEQVNVGGKSYFKSANSPRPSAYFLPDDRTIVLAPEAQVQRVLITGKAASGKPDWAAEWPAGEAVAMVNMSLLNAAIGPALKQPPPEAAVLGSFSPLWEQTERVYVSAKISEGLQLQMLAQCRTPEQAQQVGNTLEAGVTLAKNMLSQLANQLASAPQPPPQAGAILALSDLGTEILKRAELKTEATVVRLQSQTELDVADTAVSVLAPAVLAARGAAQRAQSMNNMKQIMLAMHNYADVNKHFPAAVVIGPDGKTPHSWRIELLPYLDRAALYQQYKMDEPWDSENNKKVLEQIPVVFRHAQADPKSKFSSYFLLTGDTTIFPGMKPTAIPEITDGTSNTIAVVEAQRPIPWTKPEDIPYDPAKPLPKLGGYEPNTFSAAFADGSVRAIQNNVDQNILRALISRAGGEVISSF